MGVIVAPATPWGRSALALVRASGAGVAEVASSVVVPMRDGPWRSGRGRRVQLVVAGEVIDDGVAVFREGPRTATGEDLLEITTHGNPLIVQAVLDALVDAGARIAQPGEFTRRAWLNGKLDLLAAESVDLVVRATTPGGLRVGRSGLRGALRQRLEPVRATLIDAVAELEARLDHPDDELAFRTDAEIEAALRHVAQQCADLARSQRAGEALVNGIRVALVGDVNAGKSSLFNRLLGRDRALVHDAPGTTRDVVEAACTVGPLQVTLLDTAGERPTADPVEAAGMALARELVSDADLLIVVLRARDGSLSASEHAILARTRERLRVIVLNGIDEFPSATVPEGALATSARTGHGMESLRNAIMAASGVSGSEGLLVATARQRDALQHVAQAIDDALEALPVAGVAVAAELLTEGLGHLDGLTGADTREDVLDALFSRFCIGK